MTVDVSQSLEAEGAAILAEIEAMSQQNVAAFGWEESRFGPGSLPACDALRRILRADVSPSDWWLYGDERRYCHDAVNRAFCKYGERDRRGLGPSGAEMKLALDEAYEQRNAHWQTRCDAVAESSDGDSPASLDGADSVSLPEYRNWYREPDRRALTMREWSYERSLSMHTAGIRTTHPNVHRALAGDETEGGTIAGCRFCAGAPR